MKVSLVVASGIHQGKAIPIVGPQFLIGRDPQCHLRPASQAVSKQHCAVVVRDGKVFLKDFGSTNGSVLNDAIVKGEERQIKNNDSVKIGPLDFTVRIELPAARDDGTPMPDRADSAALAAVRAAAASLPGPKAPVRDATPGPKTPGSRPPASKPPAPSPSSAGTKDGSASKSGIKEGVALPAKPAAAPTPAPTDTGDEHEQDRLAAMLLGMDDEDVPGGSTVVDVPVVDMTTEMPAGGKPADAKKPVKEDTSNAASDLLRRYMRRPK